MQTVQEQLFITVHVAAHMCADVSLCFEVRTQC